MIIKKKYNFLKPFKVKKLIRLGRNYDGGYLVCSNNLKKCKNLITLGVGDDFSFEKDFFYLNKLNKIFLFDHTVNHLFHLSIIFKFFRRFITFRTPWYNLSFNFKNYINFLKFKKKDNIKFFPYKVVKKIKNKNQINLKKIFSNIESNDNLLKIDIEGDEYKLTNDIFYYNNKIRMLIIEFHWITKNSDIFIKSVKLLKKKFDIVHIHINNHKPFSKNDDFFDVVELTFVNKKLNRSKKIYRSNFPIKKLDYECFPHLNKVKFSFKD